MGKTLYNREPSLATKCCPYMQSAKHHITCSVLRMKPRLAQIQGITVAYCTSVDQTYTGYYISVSIGNIYGLVS